MENLLLENSLFCHKTYYFEENIKEWTSKIGWIRIKNFDTSLPAASIRTHLFHEETSTVDSQVHYLNNSILRTNSNNSIATRLSQSFYDD
jgi:hypothetical protein